MSKKIIALVLIMMLMLSICACGAKELPVSEPEPTPTPRYEMPKIAIGKQEEEGSAPSQEELALTNDLWDFIFEIDGRMYQFPCLFSEFSDIGWEPAYNIDSEFVAAGKDELVTFRLGDKKIGLIFYNDTDEMLPILDCIVGGITAHNDAECVDVYMARDVRANKVTPDLARKLFGEPYYIGKIEGSPYPNSYTYCEEADTNQEIYYRFFFDEKTGDARFIWANRLTSIGG